MPARASRKIRFILAALLFAVAAESFENGITWHCKDSVTGEGLLPLLIQGEFVSIGGYSRQFSWDSDDTVMIITLGVAASRSLAGMSNALNVRFVNR